jgi:fructokinase
VNTFIYITVGTGIGGGAFIEGQAHHGLVHPEIGHILIPHNWETDPYPGCCPYHGDCLEGMASGPALEERWGNPGSALPTDHPAWKLEANYLGLAIHNLICTISPQRIIVGGGVLKQASLLPLVRKEVLILLNGYISALASPETISRYIVLPDLGNMAGVLGALALAEKAHHFSSFQL